MKNVKKVMVGVSVLCLSLGLSLSGVVTTQATSNDSSVVAASYTKTVYHNKYYSGNVTPTPSIFYSQGGWSGTLYLQTYAFDGTNTIASYKGTVTCTSNCAMSNSEVE